MCVEGAKFRALLVVFVSIRLDDRTGTLPRLLPHNGDAKHCNYNANDAADDGHKLPFRVALPLQTIILTPHSLPLASVAIEPELQDLFYLSETMQKYVCNLGWLIK